ncbi:MAG: lamin tail domain-containing protein [archaeon]
MKKLIILLILVLFISGCSTTGQVIKKNLEPAFVVEILDGDTIRLPDESTVRFLGINTPETGEDCSKESKDRVRDLILGKWVYLEKDQEDLDQYFRKLRYIYLDEKGELLLNSLLVEEGLAVSYSLEPNTKYSFKEAQEKAISLKIGCLWENTKILSCLEIKEFVFDAVGDDCKKPNGEYIVFKNNCNSDLDMNNWEIRDSSRKKYIFNYIFKKGTEFTFYSGVGTDTATKIYWGNAGTCGSVWNNAGDNMYLKDSDGNLVSRYSY